MIVSNTSPLIFLGKIGKLNLLKDLFEKVKIPLSVEEEIKVKDDSLEWIELNKAKKEGWIKIEEVHPSELLKSDAIAEAEKKAITLADQKNCIVLLDDDQAKAYADIVGVESHGTLYVIMKAKTEGLITADEATEILDNMMEKGFYISTQVYKRFQEYMKE